MKATKGSFEVVVVGPRGEGEVARCPRFAPPSYNVRGFHFSGFGH